jgi:hypothetical protein
MDCVNHNGVPATAYCQSCGKALCSECVRNVAGGQIFCEPCRAAWQGYQQPFAAPPAYGPNPAVAGALGIIPGVGAMYNGQFFKGMIHVVIFAVLISITDHYPIFGLFIAAWVLYQAFEAFHTAKARRDGQPLPDPFGLNELGGWLGAGRTSQNPAQNPGWSNPAAQAPYNPGEDSVQQAAVGEQSQAGWQTPYTGQNPPPFAPPMPPMPPMCWPNRTPFGAVVLIGLGLLFLLHQLDFFTRRIFDFAWPLGLIALGVWLAVNRMGNSQGGSK